MPAEPAPTRFTVAGAAVLLVGYFSAKEKKFETLMDSAAAELEARGARVVGRIVQRRGVSAGGARKMSLPLSSRTLLSSGKVREVARACERAEVDTVVFVATLTPRQQRALTALLGRPVVGVTEARSG
jgi:50S ribosomal subunit-associated GTPase HflX